MSNRAMHRRLLRRLNRVFNRTPGEVLALRVRSDGGLTWTLAKGALTIHRPGRAALVLALDGVTVAGLRDQLATAGVLAWATDVPAILVLGALALVPGSGDQDLSNGDHLYVGTRILWSWAMAVGRWLDTARGDLTLMLRQLLVPQAGGDWSDLWASYFGLLRRPGEADAHLNMRTAYEWKRERSNPVAIEKNIQALLGATVEVREPWQEMFRYDTSALSGGDALPDGTEFRFHVAQLVARDAWVDFPAAMVEAEADRPAGTLFLPPAYRPRAWLVPLLDGSSGIVGGPITTYTFEIRDYDGGIFDYNFALSSGPKPIPAPSLTVSVEAGYSAVRPDAPLDMAPLVLVPGELVLSEYSPLDTDVQARWAGGRQLVESGAPMVLSGSGALSDSTWALSWVAIETWSEATLGAAATGAATVSDFVATAENTGPPPRYVINDATGQPAINDATGQPVLYG